MDLKIGFEEILDFLETFWGSGWIVVLEEHSKLVEAAFPGSAFFAGNSAFPVEEIESAVGIFAGTSDVALKRKDSKRTTALKLMKENAYKGMIFAPGFSFFG